MSLTKPLGTTAGWGLCVGSSKVDLWSAARNEDNRFIGAGDALGMIFNKALVWAHLINMQFFFKKCTFGGVIR